MIQIFNSVYKSLHYVIRHMADGVSERITKLYIARQMTFTNPVSKDSRLNKIHKESLYFKISFVSRMNAWTYERFAVPPSLFLLTESVGMTWRTLAKLGKVLTRQIVQDK